MTPHVLLAGRFAPGALELAYVRAFQNMGWTVTRFDFEAALRRNCRLGEMGYQFNRFVPVEPWIEKANRELVLEARRSRPDLIVVFGQTLVRPGALAQLRVLTTTRVVLVWVDSLVNLSHQTIAALPIYDLVASYSRAILPALVSLGARRAEWVPLAADPVLHPAAEDPPADAFRCDVSFIGRWLPDREAVLAGLLDGDGSLDVKIWGPDWGRRLRGKPRLRAAWQGKPVFGADFSHAVRGGRLSLNVVDPTTYPTSNMRFFEIPAMNGLQLSTRCPEVEEEFVDGESVFYYDRPEGLAETVRSILADPQLQLRVRETGHRKVMNGHLYAHRAARIAELVGL